MSLPFKLKYDDKRKCPGCRQRFAKGEQAQFESIKWPWEAGHCSPRDIALWHVTCVNTALVEALCAGCGLLHKDQGMCLI